MPPPPQSSLDDPCVWMCLTRARDTLCKSYNPSPSPRVLQAHLSHGWTPFSIHFLWTTLSVPSPGLALRTHSAVLHLKAKLKPPSVFLTHGQTSQEPSHTLLPPPGHCPEFGFTVRLRTFCSPYSPRGIMYAFNLWAPITCFRLLDTGVQDRVLPSWST